MAIGLLTVNLVLSLAFARAHARLMAQEDVCAAAAWVTALQLILEVWFAAPCVLERLVTEELTALLRTREGECQIRFSQAVQDCVACTS